MNVVLKTMLVGAMLWGGSTLAAIGGSVLLWAPMAIAGGWMLGTLAAKAHKYDELSARVIRW